VCVLLACGGWPRKEREQKGQQGRTGWSVGTSSCLELWRRRDHTSGDVKSTTPYTRVHPHPCLIDPGISGVSSGWAVVGIVADGDEIDNMLFLARDKKSLRIYPKHTNVADGIPLACTNGSLVAHSVPAQRSARLKTNNKTTRSYIHASRQNNPSL
jgi:hypothetical protein